MGVIIRNGIEYSGAGMGGGSCDCDEIVYLTQAEYDALPESKLTNGVEYRITDSNPPAPTAKDMAYDNSESGIEAETVQNAIDEMNESLNWKLLGDFSETVSLPENFNEVYIYQYCNTDTTNNKQGIVGYDYNIPKAMFDGNTKMIMKGSYGSTTSGAQIIINADNTISRGYFGWDNASATSSLKVYYR